MEENQNLIKKENIVGRPTKMTKETLQKLEEVFALDGTDKESCFYANISESTLYNYQVQHPGFLERKTLLKQTPILKARRTIIEHLDDPDIAFKYLKCKRREEFGDRVETVDETKRDNLREIAEALTDIAERHKNSKE